MTEPLAIILLAISALLMGIEASFAILRGEWRVALIRTLLALAYTVALTLTLT